YGYRRLSAWRVKSIWASCLQSADFVPAEPIHDVVIEIGQAQEADRNVTRQIRLVESAALWVRLMVLDCAADSIFAGFVASPAQGAASPLPRAVGVLLAEFRAESHPASAAARSRSRWPGEVARRAMRGDARAPAQQASGARTRGRVSGVPARFGASPAC